MKDKLLKLSDQYFNNLAQIEESWKLLRKNNFPPADKDKFWRLCNEGRMLFWQWILEEKREYPEFDAPPSVPAFQRAVMLLEFEKKYRNAIQLCEEALKWIDNSWYRKKIERFSKLLTE